MLKNAKLYEEELQKKYQETVYDLNYQYYHGDYATRIFMPENSCERHAFASVDNDGKVIGYIGYSINRQAKRAYNFGAISFDRGNLVYTVDLLKAIDDIFRKYGVSTIEFFAFVDNPITPTYTKLVEKYGGRIVGTLTNTHMLQDGRLHDTIIYEMSLWGYIREKTKIAERRNK